MPLEKMNGKNIKAADKVCSHRHSLFMNGDNCLAANDESLRKSLLHLS